MTAREFVTKFKNYAEQVELETGIPHVVILAQSALETGWGNTVVGNMMFGVKDIDGVNGNEQLLTTTEYFDNPDKKFPFLIRVVQVGVKRWKYTIKDYFRKYASPYDSFLDHAKLLQKPIYSNAMQYTDSPDIFIEKMAVHYATDPGYAEKLKKIVKMIRALS